MLTVRVGHDTDYLTEAVAQGREGYYTGAVAAGEPAGLCTAPAPPRWGCPVRSMRRQ